MNLLSNTLAFLLALGVIIFVHEAGHLLVAKSFGMRVLTFSLGFGRRLWGFQRGGTDYRVSLVPLGGYVRLGGEDPGEVQPDDPGEFLNRPRWQRVLVYLAGPAMNVVLAIVLTAGVYMVVGGEVLSIDQSTEVGVVEAGSPAAAAGLAAGDRILAIDGKAVSSWDDVQLAILTAPERPLALRVARGEDEMTVTVTPRKIPRYEGGEAGLLPKQLPRIAAVIPGSAAEAAGFQPGDEIRGVDGRAIGSSDDFVSIIETHAEQAVVVEVARAGELRRLPVVPRREGEVGRIGVNLSYFQRYGPLESIVQSLRYNGQIAVLTLRMLGKVLTGQVAAKSALSGPLEIARFSGAAARVGPSSFVQFLALISISIAILNLFPLPILDGGHVAILLIEAARRRDFPLKVKERIQQVGFVLIMMLMVMVLYFDISKTLPPGLLPGS